jgi:streptomycin 6-kinase
MQVPDDLRATIGRWAGAAGQAWLAALPGLVDSLAEDWDLAVGEPYVPSGYTSLALRVTRDGEPLVLKVQLPDEWSAGEAAALRHYAGRACVALLAHDAERWALLLERCTPGTPLLSEPDDVATAVVAGLLAELWSPPPADHAFRLLADDAAGWLDVLRSARHLPERLRDEAYELLSWLVSSPGDPVVLHTDLHAGNVLRATRRPWLAIDPKGSVGDRAFDLAPVVRDRAAPGLVAHRLDVVCDLTGVERRRARAWALVQCAEGAEWSYRAGDAVAGDEFVAWGSLVAAAH